MTDYGAWIGVTSKDQLQGVRPDPNPTMECDGPCGRSWSFKDYWDGRWSLGDPATAEKLCDECLEQAIEYHDRKTNNKDLTAFVGGDSA